MLESTGCLQYFENNEIKAYNEAELFCEAGSYKKDTECLQCPRGTWSPAGASSCTNCAVGRTSPSGSTKEDDCYKLEYGEIPLKRAELSSTNSAATQADLAIDNDLATHAFTSSEANPWLRLYFTSSSNVEKVVIEEAYGEGLSCIYSVSVFEGEVKTLCGTYTGISSFYYNETVKCGGKRGDSVMLEMTNCLQYVQIYEIKAYNGTAGCEAPYIQSGAVQNPSNNTGQTTYEVGAEITIVCDNGYSFLSIDVMSSDIYRSDTEAVVTCITGGMDLADIMCYHDVDHNSAASRVSTELVTLVTLLVILAK